ncbi:MAG: hypothetical protein R3232_01285 [Clostridia bacterium]|nr:hypothetical protein [Clostridia bacterium]
MKRINKIIVIGKAGSGKTTVADILGREFGLPVYYMDRLFFDSQWKWKPKEESIGKLEEICGRDQWVLDSMGPDTAANNLKKADMVVFIDSSKFICLINVFKRRLKSMFIPRHEAPEGSDNKIYPSFIKKLVLNKNYKKKNWLPLMEKHNDTTDFIFIKKAGKKSIHHLKQTIITEYSV